MSSLRSVQSAFALALGLAACSSPASDSEGRVPPGLRRAAPPPALLVLDDACRQALAGDATAPCAAINRQHAAMSLDAAPLTTAAQFDAFVTECEAIQPKETPKSALADSAEAGDSQPSPLVGQVYRGQKPHPVPPIPKDGIYRTVEGNPEFIDPNKVSESAGTNIVSNLFETLLVIAPGNAPARPGAALRYEVSPDGRVYTFYLRDGLVWSDGRPTTAHDFVYSWRRALDPKTASKNAQQLWILEGAKAFNEGQGPAEAVGVRALDDQTLEVRLVGPAPFFPDLVTYLAFAPVPRWAIEQHGDQWTRPANIVTNGPFLLSKWLERDRFELTKSPTYWDAANVKLAGAVFYVSESESQNQTLYESGQIHDAAPLGPDFIQKAIKDGRDDLRIDTNACVYFYALRMDRPPFSDSRVRHALNLALDKQTLVDEVLGAFQTPALGFTPPMLGAFMGYEAPLGPPRDKALAQRLMAAAGYPSGKGFPGAEIIYNTFEAHKRIAEYASRNWQEALGIKMSAANMEWKSLLKKQNAGDFQISRSAWCADYPDPMNFLEVFNSESENNYSAYKNPAYDAMLDKARVEPDAYRRRVLLCAAEKGLLRDMPFVPMYQYTRSRLIRPEVKGHLPQYQEHHLLRWISLD